MHMRGACYITRKNVFCACKMLHQECYLVAVGMAANSINDFQTDVIYFAAFAKKK